MQALAVLPSKVMHVWWIVFYKSHELNAKLHMQAGLCASCVIVPKYCMVGCDVWQYRLCKLVVTQEERAQNQSPCLLSDQNSNVVKDRLGHDQC